MARSHGINNSFSGHRHIMESQVQRYSFAFDDSFVSTIPQGLAEEIIGNQLIIDETSYPDQATCLGEFCFAGSKDSHPRVRLSLKKWIKLFPISANGTHPSQTVKYRYQIWITHSQKQQKQIQVIRFDNGHSYGFKTDHHLHIQIDGETKKLRDWPHPTHVNNNFPYLSDIFEICYALSLHEEGPIKPFMKLLGNFRKIKRAEREEPRLWVPKINSELFEFILP